MKFELIDFENRSEYPKPKECIAGLSITLPRNPNLDNTRKRKRKGTSSTDEKLKFEMIHNATFSSNIFEASEVELTSIELIRGTHNSQLQIYESKESEQLIFDRQYDDVSLNVQLTFSKTSCTVVISHKTDDKLVKFNAKMLVYGVEPESRSIALADTPPEHIFFNIFILWVKVRAAK